MDAMLTLPMSAELRSDQLAALLGQHGRILLRGAENLSAVEVLSRRTFARFHQPATRANLRSQDGDGFSSQVGKDTRLLGHAESYYRPCLPPPDVCIFYCEKAPVVAGGETFLIDGAELFRVLPSSIAQRLEIEGIVYECTWLPDRWAVEFGVSDVDDLRRLLDADSCCDYSVNDEQILHLFFKAPAIRVDTHGHRIFINGMLTHLPHIEHRRYADFFTYARPSNRIHWGGGGLLDNDTVCQLIDAHDHVLQKHRWRDGDVLLIDNHRFLHGRELTCGEGERIIYSRFGYWK